MKMPITTIDQHFEDAQSETRTRARKKVFANVDNFAVQCNVNIQLRDSAHRKSAFSQLLATDSADDLKRHIASTYKVLAGYISHSTPNQ